MRPREILLDFTPLLDIVLTMVFFFVLFGNLDAQDYKQKAERAESAAAAAQVEKENAENLQEQAQKLLDEIAQADSREAENIVGINGFSIGKNVVLMLKMNSDGWQLDIAANGISFSVLQNETDDLAGRLDEILIESGFETDDTILLEFIYDGSQAGTAQAYRTVSDSLESLQETYDHLFFSQIECSSITNGGKNQ